MINDRSYCLVEGHHNFEGLQVYDNSSTPHPNPTIISLIGYLSRKATASATSPEDGFLKVMDRSLLDAKKEKLSHLRLYWHDILSGEHPTGATIVPPVKNSMTGFGLVRMIDNPLTLGPKMSSKCVGRAQGFYASAGLDELGFYMSMNFEFIEGKYNGSTITVQGRNPALHKVREMAVVGGSGLFRFARGYATASTHWIDFKTGDAVVEYNVYVLHY